jgi:hypothetical protein
MFTHHSLFSASLRRLNQFLVVLLSSFLTHILKSKLLSFVSCCWLLRTGTTLHVYSPFFFSLCRSNHFLVVLLSCCLVVLLSCFLPLFLSSSLPLFLSSSLPLFLSSSLHRFLNRNGCLSSLVDGCCVLGPYSLLTHHSLFSPLTD